MELENLNTVLEFIEGENGLYYKKINGFLFTVSFDRNQMLLYVNLPHMSHNEKNMISSYVKESSTHFKKLNFVKNGICIHFASDILDDLDYIKHFSIVLSKFLSSASIEFSNDNLDIILDKNMYIFSPVAAEVNSKKLADEYSEQDSTLGDSSLPPNKNLKENASTIRNKLFAFFSNPTTVQVKLIICFFIFAIALFLLNVFCIQVASVVGYFCGTVFSVIYFVKGFSAKKTFVFSALLTAAVASIATIASILLLFLNQTEFYLFHDFFRNTLTVQYCIFNSALSVLLSLFGTYSVKPVKAKKQVVIDDFE